MKNISLIVLVLLLLVVGGLVVLNKDRFKTPLQMEENKTTQTQDSATTPSAESSPAATGGTVDVDAEITNLDQTLDSVNPGELTGSDLSNTSVGVE